MRLDPKDAHPHTGLGDVRDHLGKEEEAIAKYREAIRLDPKYTEPHKNLSVVWHKQGKEDSAILECQLAVRLDPMLTPHCNVGPPFNRPRVALRAQRMTCAKFVRLRRVTDHTSLEASTYQRQRWPREHAGGRRLTNGRWTLEAAIDAVSAPMAARGRFCPLIAKGSLRALPFHQRLYRDGYLRCSSQVARVVKFMFSR
jgi:tetratricopeptide (TPR) repeat protein